MAIETDTSVRGVVLSWVRGETGFPGDLCVCTALDDLMRESAICRHRGSYTRSRQMLDDVESILAKVREHFDL